MIVIAMIVNFVIGIYAAGIAICGLIEGSYQITSGASVIVLFVVINLYGLFSKV